MGGGGEYNASHSIKKKTKENLVTIKYIFHTVNTQAWLWDNSVAPRSKPVVLPPSCYPKDQSAKQVPEFNTEVFIASIIKCICSPSQFGWYTVLEHSCFCGFCMLNDWQNTKYSFRDIQQTKEWQTSVKITYFSNIISPPWLPQHTLHILESMVLNPAVT